jgi:hypothetical protein
MLSGFACRRVSRLLWDYGRGALASPASRRVEAHLRSCARCETELRDYRSAAGLLTGFGEREIPAPTSGWADLCVQLTAVSPRIPGSRARMAGGWVAAGALAGAVVVAAALVSGRKEEAARGIVASPPAPGPSAAVPKAAQAPNPISPTRPEPREASSWRPRTQPIVPGPREEASVPSVDDVRYLDGRDPHVLADVLPGDDAEKRRFEEWVRRLPRPQDDFVSLRFPLIASADAEALRAAQKEHTRQAAVVDTRLFRKVTLQLKAASLEDVCEALEDRTGVRLGAGRSVRDEKATVLVKNQPARDVMRAVARLFGLLWSRAGDEGSYTYELIQDLKSQLAEEELRNRDYHAALVAMDEEVAALEALTRQSVDQLATRFQKATGIEKQRLELILQRGGWGAAKLYSRLTPAERTGLANGDHIQFTIDNPKPERQIPEEWRETLLRTSGLVVVIQGGIPYVPVGGGGNREEVPVSEYPGVTPRIALLADRSEAGRLSLKVQPTGVVIHEGRERPGPGTTFELAEALNPSTRKPENAVTNAALRSDALFRPVVSLRPEPSCIRHRQEQERIRTKALNPRAIMPGGTDIAYPHDDLVGRPHLAAADAWDELHRKTGLNIIADSYTRLHKPDDLAVQSVSTFDALCHTADGLGARWRKEGSFILCRSTGYFWDKLKEIPNRLLRHWQEDSTKHGGLPLDDILEISTLSDAQLNTKAMGRAIAHCWGLDEWEVIASGPFYTAGRLWDGRYVRPYVRFLNVLSLEQRKRAAGPEGIGMADLTPPQQDAYFRLLMEKRTPASDAPGTRLRLEYLPAWRYAWAPRVPRDAYETAARWPLIAGPTPDAALADARRYVPTARLQDVRLVPGEIVVSLFSPSGAVSRTGGPRIQTE